MTWVDNKWKVVSNCLQPTNLLLQLRIPVHVDEEEVVGTDQVETDATGGEWEQHHLGAAIATVEVVHDVAPQLDRNSSWEDQERLSCDTVKTITLKKTVDF